MWFQNRVSGMYVVLGPAFFVSPSKTLLYDNNRTGQFLRWRVYMYVYRVLLLRLLLLLLCVAIPAAVVAAVCCCCSSYTCHPRLFFMQTAVKHSTTHCQYICITNQNTVQPLAVQSLLCGLDLRILSFFHDRYGHARSRRRASGRRDEAPLVF